MFNSSAQMIDTQCVSESSKLQSTEFDLYTIREKT